MSRQLPHQAIGGGRVRAFVRHKRIPSSPLPGAWCVQTSTSAAGRKLDLEGAGQGNRGMSHGKTSSRPAPQRSAAPGADVLLLPLGRRGGGRAVLRRRRDRPVFGLFQPIGHPAAGSPAHRQPVLPFRSGGGPPDDRLPALSLRGGGDADRALRAGREGGLPPESRRHPARRRGRLVHGLRGQRAAFARRSGRRLESRRRPDGELRGDAATRDRDAETSGSGHRRGDRPRSERRRRGAPPGAGRRRCRRGCCGVSPARRGCICTATRAIRSSPCLATWPCMAGAPANAPSACGGPRAWRMRSPANASRKAPR